MAGLEQLEIHSKVGALLRVLEDNRGANAVQSYIVRWVKIEEGHTISWNVQPHKKSM
jgi:hypothetical protein